MLPHHLPTAQGGEADGAGAARAGMAIAAALGACLFQRGAAPARHGTAERHRRAGGGVHLLAMVHLDDLGIVLLRWQRRRHALGQGEKQVHARREIGRIDDGDLCRRLGHGGFLRRGKAGGAQHQGPLRRHRGGEVRLHGLRAGEVDHHVAVCAEGSGIGEDAVGPGLAGTARATGDNGTGLRAFLGQQDTDAARDPQDPNPCRHLARLRCSHHIPALSHPGAVRPAPAHATDQGRRPSPARRAQRAQPSFRGKAGMKKGRSFLRPLSSHRTGSPFRSRRSSRVPCSSRRPGAHRHRR